MCFIANWQTISSFLARRLEEKRKKNFLGKGRREDLQCLAEELGEQPSPDAKIVDLKQLNTASSNYEAEFAKGLLETIVETRREKEKLVSDQKEDERKIIRIGEN